MGAETGARRRPPVSVIMANRNNARSLDMFLERLERNTGHPDLEVVVVDDESSDGSVAILRRWRESGRFRAFTLIEQPHGGVMRALNAALDAAGGEVIAAMDGDATVETPGWLDTMLDLQQADARVGTVTAAVDLDDGRIQGYGMNVVGPLGAHGRGTVPTEPAGRRTAHELTANPRVEEVRDLFAAAEVDAPLGPCMLYPRELAREIGGYDVGFSPVWFDDTDFGIAARRIGLKNFVAPVRVVHHIGARHTRGDAGRAHRLAVRTRGAVGRLLPAGAKRGLWRAARRDAIPPERWARLRHHYEYWRQKWGWDFVNPDMDELLRRWGGSEICWAYDEGMRRAGEEVLRGYAGGTTPG